MDPTTPLNQGVQPVAGDLVSGEAVVLDVRLAKLPTRAVARLLDLLIQLALGAAVVLGLSAFLGFDLDSDAATATVLVLVVLLLVGYPLIFETLTRGRTPGKMALGLRIVRDDGGASGFRHALVRSLVGVLEIWITYGVVAMIASMVSSKGKRLGDQAAGTVAVRERVPRQASAAVVMPPQLAPWAATLEMSRLPDGLALSARQLLGRAPDLDPGVRAQLAQQLAVEVGRFTAPPPPYGCPPEAFLAAVLAERRRRDEHRYGPPSSPLVAGPTPAPPSLAPQPLAPPPFAAPAAAPAPAPEPAPAAAPATDGFVLPS